MDEVWTYWSCELYPSDFGDDVVPFFLPAYAMDLPAHGAHTATICMDPVQDPVEATLETLAS